MTLAELLTTIGDHIASVWPVRIIPHWKQGAKTFCGVVDSRTCTHENGLWGTGLHLFWPILGSIEAQDSNVEGVTTGEQTLTTADGESVVVQAVARYQIADMAKLWQEIHDHERTIRDAMEGILGEIVPTVDWQGGRLFGEEVVEACEPELVQLLSVWGVNLDSFNLRTCVKVTAHRVFSGGGQKENG